MSSTTASHIPGVNDVGNQRPKARVKGGKTKEVKASVPVQQPLLVEKMDSVGVKTSSSCLLSSDISTLGTDISALHSKGVTLKDLCAEDKKRIAHLIKELAKVGEEKENAEQNLNAERKHYQEQIMALVQQQEAVLKEREDVQNRLLEYQSYIVKLQQQQQLQQLLNHQQRNRQKLRQQQHPHPQHSGLHPTTSEPVAQVQREKTQLDWKKRTSNLGGVENDADGLPHHRDERVGNNLMSYNGPEDLREEPVEQPSAHFYINESIDQSGTTEGLSTHVQPSQTPPPQMTTDSSRPLPHRPFTAMIDKQLDEQRKKASAIVDRGDTDAQFLEIDAENNRRQEKEREKIGDKFSPDHEMLPGAPVSPEKMAIFSRFMDSQSHARRSEGGEENMPANRGQEKSKPKHTSEEKESESKKNLERKSRHGKGHHSSRPPASYPGFYPPIMSSTQKSSEIGDFIDSTIASDGKHRIDNGVVSKRDPHRKNARREVVKQDIAGKNWERNRDSGGNRISSGNYVNEKFNEELEAGIGGSVQENANTDRRHVESDMQGAQMRVDFMESITDDVDNMSGHHGGPADLGVDTDFLCYYKKLSAAERKQELLKQRSILLEEQTKLRHLLIQQQEKQVKKQQVIPSFSGGEMPPSGVVERRVEGEIRGIGYDPNLQSDVIVSGHGLKKGRPLKDNKPGKGSSDVMDAAGKSGRGTSRGARILTSDEKEEEGTVLKGKGGDECVTYSSGGQPSDKDNLAKKLDYSLCSDAEEGGHLPTSNLDRKFIITPTPNKADVLPNVGLSPSPSVPFKPATTSANMTSEALPTQVDAGTSISFATISGIPMENHREKRMGTTQTETVGPSQTTTAAGKASTNRKAGRQSARPCFSESPGDKTLAVLQIINSLPGENPEASPATHLLLPPHKPHSHHKNPGRIKDGGRKFPTGRELLAKKSRPQKPEVGHRQKRAITRPPGYRRLFQESAANVFGKTGGKHAVLSALGKTGSKSKSVDKELDVFDFNGWREDRMDGYRRIISSSKIGDEDDDDGVEYVEADDTFYDYNDDDDSNIDDIVDNLILSSDEEVEVVKNKEVDLSIREDYDCDNIIDEEDDDAVDDDEVNSVVKGLNFSPPPVKDSNFWGLKRMNRGQYDFSQGQGRHMCSDDDDDDDDYNDEDDLDDFAHSNVEEDSEEENIMRGPVSRTVKGMKDRVEGKVRRDNNLDKEESLILEDIFFVSH